MINAMNNILRVFRPSLPLIVLLAGMFFSCKDNNPLDESYPEWLGSSIYGYLEKQGNYSVFLQLIDDLQYDQVLKLTGSKTLFVADDEAFDVFFNAENVWGVSSYSDLSMAQKKLLLNSAMINNAYLIDKLSSVPGPEEGKCLRRTTAVSVYDSVPLVQAQELPDTKYWQRFKDNDRSLLLMKDFTPVPMVHFLRRQLENNNITDEDFSIIFNGYNRQINDAHINGIRVIDQNIVCQNGYVHKLEKVMLPFDNMAEVLRTHPATTKYSALMERFSAPYYSAAATGNYQRIYGGTDSVFVKRFFSQRSAEGGNLTDPDGYATTGVLKFDPGWNTYYSESEELAMEQDMAAMLVPSNAALDFYWEHDGRALKDYYVVWDSVPDKVLVKLLNNNMLNSFNASVPSKFDKVTNDANDAMGLTIADVDCCLIANNGVIYITNKVFGPTSYISVLFPALINESMSIINWAVEELEFNAYLNSQDSYYSFIIPVNDALKYYIDPVSYGKSKTKLFEFYYDPTETDVVNRVKANKFTIDLDTWTKSDSSSATTAEIQNRLDDMVDNLIVIGDIGDGRTYYKTKAGGIIKVTDANLGEGGMKIAGGYQVEQDTFVTVRTIYDQSVSGNGKSYIVEAPLLSSKKSLYATLKERPEFKVFYDLMEGSDFFVTQMNKHSCVDRNCNLFNAFNYTVYVPTNESLQALLDDGTLPDWEKYELETDVEIKKAIKDSIESFLRYHIQDNSVYLDKAAINGNFETSAINRETGRFYKLTVEGDGSQGLFITDLMGNRRRVLQSDPNLYNLMVREYLYDTADKEAATTIFASSYAAVHQIDAPLFFR
jgi:uncharacterized surface protein with fasciclin (FAS1) repeats